MLAIKGFRIRPLVTGEKGTLPILAKSFVAPEGVF
jgi:hypothetical protein